MFLKKITICILGTFLISAVMSEFSLIGEAHAKKEEQKSAKQKKVDAAD